MDKEICRAAAAQTYGHAVFHQLYGVLRSSSLLFIDAQLLVSDHLAMPCVRVSEYSGLTASSIRPGYFLTNGEM
jgi:hypothetical protein